MAFFCSRAVKSARMTGVSDVRSSSVMCAGEEHVDACSSTTSFTTQMPLLAIMWLTDCAAA